jgi:hypothetical protein
MPTKEPTPYRGAWKLRRCKHCKLTYAPTCKDAANASKSKFCCKKCKDSYHNNGGMNMERLVEKVVNAVRKNLLADENFAEKLADKLRVTGLPERSTPRTEHSQSAAS